MPKKESLYSLYSMEMLLSKEKNGIGRESGTKLRFYYSTRIIN